LYAGKDLKGAVASYRNAIALNPAYAEAHCNLGHALRESGLFADALKELKIGDKLGSRKPRWPYPSALWVKQCEALLGLEQKLAAIRQGKARPADAAEQLALAGLCQNYKKQYAAAAEFYAAAFAAAPDLAEDLTRPHRYNAACAAALAAAGQGKDADKLDDKKRAVWRQQARAWLRADLILWDRAIDTKPQHRPFIRQTMKHWQTDPDLVGVRNADALARLPSAERAEWAKLWQAVETLRRRTAQPK
jgi:tetratricopeptide (TPR) repeat protein